MSGPGGPRFPTPTTDPEELLRVAATACEGWAIYASVRYEVLARDRVYLEDEEGRVRCVALMAGGASPAWLLDHADRLPPCLRLLRDGGEDPIARPEPPPPRTRTAAAVKPEPPPPPSLPPRQLPLW